MAKEMTEFNNRLDKLAEYCMNSGRFDQDLYIEYDVKRGLRDSNGRYPYRSDRDLRCRRFQIRTWPQDSD